jgi:hypothetical protein
MSEFNEKVVVLTTATISPTSFEAKGDLSGYVWDTSKPPKNDPFFAVPHFVMGSNKVEIQKDEQGSVFLTF